MSGTVTIASVSGTSPNWVLAVDSTAGVQAGDHIISPLDAASLRGGVYRVESVPTGTQLDVVDDLGDPVYGKPGAGGSFFYTPTINLGLSQVPRAAYYWDVPVNLDNQVIDREIGRLSVELEDPASGLTADQIDQYKTFLVLATDTFYYGSATCINSQPYNLSGDTDWGLRVVSELGTYDVEIVTGGFGDPAAVSASDLKDALNAALPAAGGDGVVVFSVDGTAIKVERLLESDSSYVQIGIYPVGSNLNTVLAFDTAIHYSSDGVTIEIPAPNDVERLGLEVVLINETGSSGYIKVEPEGASSTQLTAGAKLQYYWDGSAWV